MKHASGGATALVGMPGFRVGAQMLEGGEWHLVVETTADVAGCPVCGSRAVGHGRRRVRVRDLPVAGRPVVLCWEKRIWRCPDPDCEKRTWSETSSAVEPSGLLTVRAAAEICRAVGAKGASVAAMARAFGISWAAAMGAVRRLGTPLVDDPERLSATTTIGVDETTFLHANAHRRTTYVTGIVDTEAGLLLDVVAGRSAAVLDGWLAAQPGQWRGQIATAALDAFRGYANALRSTLPAATLVIDHFHAVQLANRTVDRVRRRVQNESLGHRGRAPDPLYRIRRLALVAGERLGQAGFDRLYAGLETGDPTGEVAAAWLAKEHLRSVYRAESHRDARAALVRFYGFAADHAHIPELVTLAATVSAWEAEIVAYHATGGVSNGPTEAVNLLIEKTRRIGHGFRNFDNYRLRLLLACGVKWHTPPVARIRGRQPRLSA